MTIRQLGDLGAAFSRTTTQFADPASTSYRLLAEVDFLAKLALAVCWSGEELRLPRMAGLGTLERSLRNLVPVSPCLQRLRAGALGLLKTSINTGDRPTRSLLMVRNDLCHGDLYAESELAAVARHVRPVLEDVVDSFAKALGGVGVIERNGFQEIILPDQADPSPFEPLATLSPDGQQVAGLANTFGSIASYTTPGYPLWDGKETAEVRGRFLSLFAPKTDDRSHFELFMEHIHEDLEDLASENFPRYLSASGRDIQAIWTTPDGSQDVQRVDFFRVGDNNRREWRSSGSRQWSGYTDFLRDVAKWSVFANRLHNRIKRETEDVREIEEQGLPLRTGSRPEYMPATFELVDAGADGTCYSVGGKGSSLLDRVDDDVKTDAGFTQVYCLHADAGMGKTTALVHLALTRLKALQSDPGLQKPIVLYTSALGRLIDKIDSIVASALDGTRVVDSRSLRPLLREGLVVLVIDGFDELIGTKKYDKPLEALAAHLELMKGRGVLIVSARSSYLESIYSPAARDSSLNARHEVLRLQPWSRENAIAYLTSGGLAPETSQELVELYSGLVHIPFFARAILSLAMEGELSTGSSLLPQVLRAYARREAEKLRSTNNARLFDASQVEDFLVEVAQKMSDEHTDSLGRDELEELLLHSTYTEQQEDPEIAAQAAVRVQSICGLWTSEQGDFRFTLPAVRDGFLGLALGQLAKKSLSFVADRLASMALSMTTVQTLASDVGAERFKELVDYCSASTERTPRGRENVGRMISFCAEEYGWLPLALTAAHFSVLDIQPSTDIALDDCLIERLSISSNGPRLILTNCVIDELVCEERGALARLVCQGETVIHRLVLDRTELVEGWEGVGQYIQSCGGQLADYRPVPGWERPQYAVDILRQLQGLHSHFIVVNLKDYSIADDSRMRWALRHGADWSKVARALVTSGLADSRAISASGYAKARLSLKVSPREILAANIDSAASLGEFWCLLDGR